MRTEAVSEFSWLDVHQSRCLYKSYFRVLSKNWTYPNQIESDAISCQDRRHLVYFTTHAQKTYPGLLCRTRSH